MEERSSSGFDLELQGRLPEYPAWQLNLKGYQWSSNENMEQEKTWGYDAGLQWNPVNALVWEAGLRNEQDADPEFHTQMRLVYKFGEPIENMWKEPIKLASMEERVYDKVRRDNAMRVEQRIKDSAVKDIITLALDFVNDTYELNGTAYGSFTALPGASFSRSSPAITYAEDTSGNLVSFAANTPRITDKGILIEGSRTNNLPFSDFQAGYVQQGATYTPNFAVAPDGTMTAMRVQVNSVVDPGGSAYTVRTYDAVSTTAGQVITTSVYVRPITTQSTYPIVPPDSAPVQTRDLRMLLQADKSGGSVVFNLHTRAIESELGSTIGHIQELANGWMRLSITYTAVGNDAGDNQFIILANRPTSSFDPYPDGNEEVYIWGHQSELAAFPSSYIPTNGAGVTRDTDNISLSTAGWYNNVEGTVVADYEYLPVDPGYGFTYGRNNSAIFRFVRSGFSKFGNQFTMGRYLANGSGNPYHLNASFRDINGSGEDVPNINNLSTNLDGAGPFKSAARYGGNGVAITSAGIVPVTNATAFTNFQFDSMRLDSAYDGSVGFKFLRSLDYYPSEKSNANLQILTSP